MNQTCKDLKEMAGKGERPPPMCAATKAETCEAERKQACTINGMGAEGSSAHDAMHANVTRRIISRSTTSA